MAAVPAKGFNSLFSRNRQESLELLGRLKSWATGVKRDVIALWLAARDPCTPWYAKLLAALVAAYALSPIDLIPDFIPILGYLDELIVLPIGIMATVALIPNALMAEFRMQAEHISNRPQSRTAALMIILIWVIATVVAAWLAYRYLLVNWL